MKQGASQNDSFAAMESAGRLIRSLGNGELLKQYALFSIHRMHILFTICTDLKPRTKKCPDDSINTRNTTRLGFVFPKFSESF
jgi:hypothetical protein